MSSTFTATVSTLIAATSVLAPPLTAAPRDAISVWSDRPTAPIDLRQGNVFELVLKQAATATKTSGASTGSILRSSVENSIVHGADPILMSRLDELNRLHDGFLGPGSVAPDAAVLGKLRLLGGTWNSAVRVVPLHSGSVALEWNEGSTEFTAEIQSDEKLFLCIDDSRDDEPREIEIPYNPQVLRVFLSTGSWAE